MINKIFVRWVLIIGLIVSLFGNIVLYSELTNQKSLLVQGTFQLGSGSTATYLILDDKGNFCRYNQQMGVLNQGIYQSFDKGLYTLIDNNDNAYCMVRTVDGIYIFSKDNKKIDLYKKLTSNLVLYQTPTEYWPDWCKSP